MVFKYTGEQVLAGNKTQTRRLIAEGETNPDPVIVNGKLIIAYVFSTRANRVKWRWQGRYAVQPGYGKKAIAYIEITNIR